MTPSSVLSLAPDSKSSIESFVSHFIDEMESGNLDVLKTFFLCKSWEETIKQIKEVVKKEALYEASKYGKGEHEIGSFGFSITSTGGKPDYSMCNDPILSKMLLQVKEREEYLKSLKTHEIYVDEDTGEEITIKPLVKKSGETIKISIK